MHVGKHEMFLSYLSPLATRGGVTIRMDTLVGLKRKTKVITQVMIVRGDVLGLGPSYLSVSFNDGRDGKAAIVDWRHKPKSEQRLRGLGMPPLLAKYLVAGLATIMEKKYGNAPSTTST